MKRQNEDESSQAQNIQSAESVETPSHSDTDEAAEVKQKHARAELTGFKFIKPSSHRHSFQLPHSHRSTHSHRSHHSSRRHHHHKKKKMKRWKKVLLIVLSVFLALVIAFAGTVFYLIQSGRSELFDTDLKVIVPETVQAEVQDNGDYIYYKGATYKYNRDITNLLFLGVDKRNIEGENVQGTGGQADAIVMIALDVKHRKMTMTAVPRDTIAEVALYTPGGNYNGMQNMQVCLAYAYGDGKESSCENTVASVKRIFYNLPVKTYYALDLDGIAAMNDSVGGVDVVSPEDVKNPDADNALVFAKGGSYHLEGRQAEQFVRLRDTSRLDSSLLRLERQKVYANSFLKKMTKNIKSDITSAVTLFNESSPYSCTNLSASKVAYLARELAFEGGMTTEMQSVPGKISYDGKLAKYEVDNEKFFEQFLSIYYEKM